MIVRLFHAFSRNRARNRLLKNYSQLFEAFFVMSLTLDSKELTHVPPELQWMVKTISDGVDFIDAQRLAILEWRFLTGAEMLAVRDEGRALAAHKVLLPLAKQTAIGFARATIVGGSAADFLPRVLSIAETAAVCRIIRSCPELAAKVGYDLNHPGRRAFMEMYGI